MKVLLENGRDIATCDVLPHPNAPDMPDLNAVRGAMFAWQQHTESSEITAMRDGKPIARMTFEWVEEDEA